MTQRLKNRLALITGASRGIGAAVAKRYAEEGAHVILVARTVGALEEVDDAIQQAGGKATLVPLDLLEYAKIDELGGILAKRFGYLDILVGNAGILGALSPTGHFAPDVWEKVINLNLNANWRLLRSMDPLLRASKAGRALFVTSAVARHPFAYWGAYAASKAGLEMMVKTYAAEVDSSLVRANLIDPGIVATRMRKEAMPGENPAPLPQPEDITEQFVVLAETHCQENGHLFFARSMKYERYPETAE